MSFNDNHLKVYFMSLFIFALCFCGIYYLLSAVYPETYKGDKGYVRSFILLAIHEDGDEKILVDTAYLFGNSDYQKEHKKVEITDKTIDVQNQGIWLTEGQCDLGIIAVMSAVLAAFIFLLTGLGAFFEWLRPYFGLSVGLLFCFPPFGAAVLIPEILAVCLIGILLPVYLTVELVLGIKQNLAPGNKLFKSKAKSQKAASLS
ncbi:hypothetical protein [Ruminococcus sp.]|uniref:hypothetical protein n=1 Tax=Ruminococcus sp. TaxID=41978 RepID=UPI002583B5BD|nr:hypothetical protein [Ruminococcus sp.]MCR5021807.1 hypothetical protein [Ruminococcus sp.]